ncbi:MAG: transglycosylase SLT domain-containing protein [Hydrogenothermaceae bacterium]|nr:transglycosylase SLT domain-containing protein [Hydrogenothermaceae bacterium]
MRVYLFVALVFSFFITSCSVQVKEVRQKPTYKYTKKQDIQTDNAVREQEKVVKEEISPATGKGITRLVEYQLSSEEKDFLIKEAKVLNIPIPEDSDIEYFINYYTTTKRYFTENALKRANYFLPMVKRVFREEGLPEELSYLAVVESGFNPFATSPANAAGIWQFIPSTAKRFGLLMNDYVDERRDPYKSTVAAAKYLKFLYNTFGSWELAIAGYNCGEKCVQKRADSVGSYKFSDIKYSLPKETMEYVPRFFAILLIVQNPQKYGIDTNSNVYDMLTIQSDRETTLENYALDTKIDTDIIRFYNGHFKKGLIVPGANINIPKIDTVFDKRYIYLPSQKTVVVSETKPNKQDTKKEHKDDNFILAILKKDQKPDIVKTSYKKEKTYKVEKGDTLYNIARKFGLDVETLKMMNNLQGELIREGDVLVVE